MVQKGVKKAKNRPFSEREWGRFNGKSTLFGVQKWVILDPSETTFLRGPGPKSLVFELKMTPFLIRFWPKLTKGGQKMGHFLTHFLTHF